MKSLSACFYVFVFMSAVASAQSENLSVKEARIVGQIDKTYFTFSVQLNLTTTSTNQSVEVIRGDVALERVVTPTAGVVMQYNPDTQAYVMTFAHAGRHEVELQMTARSLPGEDTSWREVRFTLPSAQVRPMTIRSQRVDLEIELPGAMRVQRQVLEGTLELTALQGAQPDFRLQWKPKVQALDAKLVVSSEANTIVTMSVGALRMDTLMVFDIAQGKLDQITLNIPASLNITQVRGEHIRDWQLKPNANGQRELLVILNRSQQHQYRLQLLAEMPLSQFPVEIDMPVIEPTRGIRAGGHLVVGTDSAIQMVVQQSGGLSQIDASALPRIVLDPKHARKLPTGKAFYYSYASSTFQLRLAMDNIVPAYDVIQRHVMRVSEDDLTLESELELDVRDAPIRDLIFDVPTGFSMVSATGAEVEDYHVMTKRQGETVTPVRLKFRQPLLGRSVVKLRMELGHSPIDITQQVDGVRVKGAINQRGYVVVLLEEGLHLQPPKARGLREISTSSVPVRVPNAQFAYRFREADWSVTLTTSQNPAGIRMESFHLLSLGEGVAYGSVAANYFITDSPVDELHYIISPELDNIQFVGRDIRRWEQDPDDPTHWIVTLQRKVMGDYNLGVTYIQRYSDGERILIGGVQGKNVQTQVGYLGVASHLNLKLTPDEKPDSGLLSIDREEMPANYRLLINAPLLRSYKYVAAPHENDVLIHAYERGTLIPVVIELMEAETQVVLQNSSEVESSTRIRYKIKNASNQFLTLAMPSQSNVWGIRQIGCDANGQETSEPLATSFDKVKGLLMIPLQRPRNPNEPITIEIEYGQVHKPMGWNGHVQFAAPVTDVLSTFDSWTFRVPKSWAILPAGGTMKSEPRQIHHGNISTVMESIGESWRQGWNRFTAYRQVYLAIVAAFIVLLVLFLVHRPAVIDGAIGGVLIGAIWIGFLGSQSPAFDRQVLAQDNLQTIEYTQVMDLDSDRPLDVAISILPQWRQYATFVGTIVVPAIALACFVGSFFLRRLRPLLLAAGLTSLLFAACQLPTLSPWLGHIFTWGIPLFFAILFLWRVVVRRLRHQHPSMIAVTATGLMLSCLTLTGCGTTTLIVPETSHIVADRVELNLTAEQDSMAGEMTLVFSSHEPMSFQLLPSDAILLDQQTDSDQVKIKRTDQGYVVRVNQSGQYTMTARFLLPLHKVDETQRRTFAMALPISLTKHVNVTMPQTGIEVQIPTATRMSIDEINETTVATATLGPKDDLRLHWRPRDRQRENETTRFFTTVTTVVKFDAGLIEARHDVQFEIAQGQLSDVKIVIPGNMTVTAVEGENLGAWRFNPATHELEIRLSKPALGDYRLRLITQIPAELAPAEITIARVRVLDAVRQRGTFGIVTSDAVDISVSQHPQAMNTTDFARDAMALLSTWSDGLARSIRSAYRFDDPNDRVVSQMFAVQPEIRSLENASFTVADDRLVYVGGFDIVIAKAGMFAFTLTIPEGYDIDSLIAEGMSHWDEVIVEGDRRATVHFANKRLGPIPLQIALSRPIAGLPSKIDVPRVELLDAIKHTGQVVISAERGVRLTVASREGVSELDPVALGIRQQGTLAFRLLRPTWGLSLKTEVVEPRITVDALHVAKVSEGLVRHTHYLRYTLRHAGMKEFEVQVEPGSLGLLITGPNIARRQLIDPVAGRWRIELVGKWYDQPYPLTIRYETRFDREGEQVEIHPALALDADLQRGFVVIRSNERVELAAQQVGATLQVAEARTIPRHFGAGDLSDAALSYRSASADYDLILRAIRHEAAELLEAEVLSTDITSVVTERGEAIHHVEMELRVGAKRNLETQLPDGADIWSLLVNGRATLPSIRRGARSNPPVFLIPLAQSAAGDLPVHVDLVYVVPGHPQSWSDPAFHGPRFDLPLQNIHWTMYVPENYHYDHFDGTLNVNEQGVARAAVAEYDVAIYEKENYRFKEGNINKAVEYQIKGSELAGKGDQRAAKQALENALAYSVGDEALNEDARVQLNRFNRRQALAGLVQSRGRLRQAAGPAQGDVSQAQQAEVGEGFSLGQIERLRRSLSQSDSENLEMIISQLIKTQDAAVGTSVPLRVSMPLRGRVLTFSRAIQVKPNAEMLVRFEAERVGKAGDGRSYIWTAGLLFVLLIIFAGKTHAMQTYQRWRTRLAPADLSEAMDEDFYEDLDDDAEV